LLDLWNEGRASKKEWLTIPYTWQTLEGEQILRLAADELELSYHEKDQIEQDLKVEQCTRVSLAFDQTALQYFFPYAYEQELLSTSERQYMQSLDTLEITDRTLIDMLAKELGDVRSDAFVWKHGVAELQCYFDNAPRLSLRVYNNSEVIVRDGQVLSFEPPGYFRSLARVTPQIQAFTKRVECAGHLQDLWWRLRLYPKVKAPSSQASRRGYRASYPPARNWCDALSTAYWRLYSETSAGPYACPAAGKGRCHYAINPDCRYGSSGEVVLLFETKAGWNRYGGPEVFTFENHDPRGGMVVLNDGKTKFIRTKEELRQLRWK
jgi:hypothetical protein